MNSDRTEDSDVLRADPARKRQAFVLIGALIVAGALLKWLGLPALMRWVTVADNAVLLHRVGVVFDALAALMLVMASYAGWHASRILRSNQFPPPHSWVLRDTPIVRGSAARLRGWAVLACAAAFVALAVYAVMLPVRLQNLMQEQKPELARPLQIGPPRLVHPLPRHPLRVAPPSPPIATPHG